MPPQPERQKARKLASEAVPKLVSDNPAVEKHRSSAHLREVTELDRDALISLPEDERVAALQKHHANLQRLQTQEKPKQLVTGGILSREYLNRNASKERPTTWRRGLLHLNARNSRNAELKQRLEAAKKPTAIERAAKSVANALRSLGLSTLAIFPTVNMTVGKEMLTPAPAARASTLEETQRIEHAWTVQPQSTIMFGAEDSSFADLLTDDKATLNLPNLFFNRDGTSLYGEIRVGRSTSFTVSGPELLQRLVNARCAQDSSSAMLEAEFGRRVARYTEQVERGEIHRSSLALEVARMSGYERESGRDYIQILNDGDNMNWEGFQASENLSDGQMEVIRDIVSRVPREVIEGIFLAELTPQMAPTNSQDGELRQQAQAQINIRLYDFMLRRYGREFVNNFPALGDDVPIYSGGPGQITNWVVGENRSTGILNRFIGPAAYQELALPTADGTGIRTSIAETASDIASLEENRVISYLNLVWNIVHAAESGDAALAALTLIRDGLKSESPATRLEAQDRIAEFAGMAHNNPRITVPALVAWYGSQQGLDASMARFATDENVRDYGTSMRFNFDALYAYSANYREAHAQSGVLGGRIGGPILPAGVTLPGDSDEFDRIRASIRNGVQ